MHQVGFSLHSYNEMHGQQNIKFGPCMFSGCKYLHNFVVNVALVGNNCDHMYSAFGTLVRERVCVWGGGLLVQIRITALECFSCSWLRCANVVIIVQVFAFLSAFKVTCCSPSFVFIFLTFFYSVLKNRDTKYNKRSLRCVARLFCTSRFIYF